MIGVTFVGKYFQGYDAMSRLAPNASVYGNKALAIIDTFFFNNIENELKTSFSNHNMILDTIEFEGEITKEKLDDVSAIAKRETYDIVIGIGGGKTMDLAKAVANNTKSRCVIVPTSAASDAPCSSLSIVYDKKENTREILRCNCNPDMILVDSKIMINAPIRFLIAGIGDAMSTYYEMLANEKSKSYNWIPGNYYMTHCSKAIAGECRNILINNTSQAVKDARNKICSEAFESIIEANILLSGIGFENTGCAASHSISAGLSAIDSCKNFLHGEKVAFGVLVQLVIENWDMTEINTVLALWEEIGLPTKLSDLGIYEDKEYASQMIAKKSMNNTFWDHEPFAVTEKMITEAILETDAIGNAFQRNGENG